MATVPAIVDVNVTITGSGVDVKNLSRCLFMTPDTTLLASNRLQVFSTFSSIASTFATTTEPYQAGQIYFAQTDIPGDLMVGRVIDSTVNASLVGGLADSNTLTALQAISDGEFTLTQDATPVGITGLNFTTAANFGDIITILNGATGVDGTFAYDAVNQRFTYTADNATITLDYLTDVTGGTGTQIATILALTATTATGKNNQLAPETLVEAFQAFRQINDSFYFVVLDVAYRDNAQVLDLAKEIEALGFYMLFADSVDENLTLFNEMNTLQLERTAGNFQQIVSNPSGYTKYLSVSVASYFTATNFDEVNGVRNSFGQAMPLIQPNKLSATLIDTLEQKNVNYYNLLAGDISNQNVQSSYFNGTTFKDTIYQDIRYNVDWLQTVLTTNLTNFRRNLNGLPRTAFGQSAAIGVVDGTFDGQIVPFGMVAPGQLSDDAVFQLRQITRNAKATGFLQKGHYTYSPPLTQESETNRANRAPLILYTWCKSSGQINQFILNVNFNL